MKLKAMPADKYDALVKSVSDSMVDFYTVEYNPSKPWQLTNFAEHVIRRVAKEMGELEA